MKMKKYWLFFLVVTVTILSACSNKENSINATFTPVPTATPIPTFNSTGEVVSVWWQTSVSISQYVETSHEGWHNAYYYDNGGRALAKVELRRESRENTSRPVYEEVEYIDDCYGSYVENFELKHGTYKCEKTRREFSHYEREDWVWYKKYFLEQKSSEQLEGSRSNDILYPHTGNHNSCSDLTPQLTTSSVGVECYDRSLKLGMTVEFQGHALSIELPDMETWLAVQPGSLVGLHVQEDGTITNMPNIQYTPVSQPLLESFHGMTVSYDGFLWFQQSDGLKFMINNSHRQQPQEIIWRSDGSYFLVVYPTQIDFYSTSAPSIQVVLEDVGSSGLLFRDVDYSYNQQTGLASVAVVVWWSEEPFVQIKVWKDEVIGFSKFVQAGIFTEVELSEDGNLIQLRAGEWSPATNFCEYQFSFVEDTINICSSK